MFKSLVLTVVAVLGGAAAGQAQQPYPYPQPGGYPPAFQARVGVVFGGAGPAPVASNYLPVQQPVVPNYQSGQPSVVPAVPAIPAAPATQDTPPAGQPEPRVKLYYRECVHDQWRYVGCFECIHDAQDAAVPLQRAGYQVFFRNCR